MINVVLLFISLACAVACHYIAKRKGVNATFWLVMGVLFGPLAIPFVLFIPQKKNINH